MKRRAFVFALAAAAVVPPALAQKSMKIGVIGSGRIGSTIGGLWVKAGHEVMFSDRDPEQVKRAIDGLGPELRPKARAGSVAEAVAFGDAVLIAVPYMALPVAADDLAALKLGMQLVSDAGFDPVNAGSLAASKAFDLGSSVSGQVMTAEEMRKALSLK